MWPCLEASKNDISRVYV